MADFAVKYPQEFLEWQRTSNYLCCLEATNFKIDRVISLLDELKIKYCVFLEPDIDNQRTAVAVESLPRKLHKQIFKSFKLALS